MSRRAFAFIAVTIALSSLTAFAAAPALAQDLPAPQEQLAPPASQRPSPGEAGKQCINADEIISYHTISDELVIFEMLHSTVQARLKKTCAQLHYHGYISYQPVNGQLCAGFDDIISRAGMPCRIESFSVIESPPAAETNHQTPNH